MTQPRNTPPPIGAPLLFTDRQGGRHRLTVSGHLGQYVLFAGPDGEPLRFHCLDDRVTRSTNPASWPRAWIIAEGEVHELDPKGTALPAVA